MSTLKKSLHNMRYIAWMLIGGPIYLITGKTLPSSHFSMIALFCATKGYSNDFLSWLVGLFKGRYRFSRGERGVLGAVGDEESQRAIALLRAQGHYVFKNRLSDEMCDRFLSYATTHPAEVRQMDGDVPGALVKEIFHRDQPHAVRYDFLPQDLLKNEDIQQLLADMSLAAFAQDYLGTRPIVDIVALWWLTKFSDTPDKEAAQFFHFDMDRLKWLKFFIYITDVGPENGPHTFVEGSHRTGAISSELLSKGYARLTDEEVSQHFDQKQFIEFSAPRGTIIAEDTRGLHKGKHVTAGDRLVLQFQFSNSLFGATHTRPQLGNDLEPLLETQIKKYPDVYSYLRAEKA